MVKKIFVVCLLIFLAAMLAASLIMNRGSARAGRAAREKFGVSTLLRSEDIMALAEWRGSIMAGGKNGVFRVDPATLTAEPVKFGRDVAYVKALAADRNGSLWVGYDGGIAVMRSDGSIEYFDRSNGLPDSRVNALYIGRDGAVWVGTRGGAAKYSGGGWKYFTEADGLKSDMVNAILEDSRGGMWFGSYTVPDGGITVIGPDGGAQFIGAGDGLPNVNICGLIETGSGSVWVAAGFYDRGGAAEMAYSEGSWRVKSTLAKADGLAGEKVRSIYLDSSGRLWLGSEYDGLAVIKDGQKAIRTESDGLSNNEIKVFLEGSDGRLWIGTREGLNVVRADKLAGFPD